MNCSISSNSFSISTLFKCENSSILKTQFRIRIQFRLFDPYIRPYQVLPLQARVNLGTIAMKGYSAFPKAPDIQDTC